MPDPRIFPVDHSIEGHTEVMGVTTEVLAVEEGRVEADFINDGDEIIYLARGNDAVVGDGIRLNPKGGSYHMGIDNLYMGIINAISVNDAQDFCLLSWSEGHRK